MTLVKCPHCSTETTNRRSECYYCGRNLSDQPKTTRQPSAADELGQPLNADRSRPSSYTIGMYWFLASLAFYAVVFGAKAGDILGLMAGIALALGVGLAAYLASLLIYAIISPVIGEHNVAVPIIAILIVCAAIFLTVHGGVKDLGGDGCMESGRYGEYSRC